MAIEAERITVGTSATALNAANQAGERLYLKIDSGLSGDVDLGPSDVTSGAGYVLTPGDLLGVVTSGSEQLFGIVSSGSTDVQVLRTGV